MGRRPKAWGPPIDGLYIIDKPVGPTSMDVVRKVRKAAQGVRCGHGGTLDPLASGVLVCCLGKGTKLVEKLMDHDKDYETTIDLSAFSETDDAEGAKTPIDVATPPDDAAIEAALAQHRGDIMQQPPIYSALKVDGKAAYARARAGEDVKLAKRPARIDRLVVTAYTWPYLSLSITCGRGTYIRSLARSIGEQLGTGGYLTELRRTRVGQFSLDGSTKLDELKELIGQEDLIALDAVVIPDTNTDSG